MPKPMFSAAAAFRSGMNVQGESGWMLAGFRGNCSVDTRECASYTSAVEKQRFFSIGPASRGACESIRCMFFSVSIRSEGCREFVLAMKGVSRECRAKKKVQI